MKYGMIAAVALLATAGAADAAVFDISMTAGDKTGTGTITIADGLINPNAVIFTSNALVDILFDGFSYGIPFSPDSEAFLFDALGQDIVGVADATGSFVDFGRTDGAYSFLNFNEGSVPGAFATYALPGGDVQGTFSITRASSSPSAAVPLPATGMLLLGAIGGVAALRRRKSV